MKPEIFRIAVDLMAPGALLTERTARWYAAWDEFHTNRIIYPVMPSNLLFESLGDKFKVRTDCAHVRITPIGVDYVGLCDGVADFILSHTRLDYFLGNELHRIVQKALMTAPPYKLGFAFVSWLEIWDVDEEAKQGRRIRDLTANELKQLAEQPDVPIRTIFQK